MTSNVVLLNNGALYQDPNQEIVALIEAVLEKAKSGGIRGFAYVSLSEVGDSERGWECDSLRDAELTFAAARLVHRMNINMDEIEQND